MLRKRSARILQHACVMMTLAVVLLDLSKWAVIAAMFPAIALLIDCGLVWMRGGRRE